MSYGPYDPLGEKRVTIRDVFFVLVLIFMIVLPGVAVFAHMMGWTR